MKVVIDTNCLLVIVPKRSPFRWVYDLILQGKIQPIITTEIVEEYAEQLELFYSLEYADTILKVFMNLANVIRVDAISFNWLLIPNDPDDNKFVDAYVASNSDVIITNDRHYNSLRKVAFPKIRCVKLEKFEKFYHDYLTQMNDINL